MKKIISSIIFFSIAMYIFSFEFKDIEGSWLPAYEIKSYDSKYIYINNLGYKNIPNVSVLIMLSAIDNDLGVIQQFGISSVLTINAISHNNDNDFILSCYVMHNDKDNEWEKLDDFELKIHFIDKDEITMYNFFSGGKKEITWYRISGPAGIPMQNAVLNDSRVRLRVKPNLSCDTWSFLNKGDTVKIKDKSEEPFTIDGESWYWYKVETDDYPDGWVYGKYLDIEK